MPLRDASILRAEVLLGSVSCQGQDNPAFPYCRLSDTIALALSAGMLLTHQGFWVHGKTPP